MASRNHSSLNLFARTACLIVHSCILATVLTPKSAYLWSEQRWVFSLPLNGTGVGLQPSFERNRGGSSVQYIAARIFLRSQQIGFIDGLRRLNKSSEDGFKL